MLGDRPAESGPLLCITNGELECPNANAAGPRGHIYPADLDTIHHVDESPARVSAQHLVVRRTVTVEDQFRGVGPLYPSLSILPGMLSPSTTSPKPDGFSI